MTDCGRKQRQQRHFGFVTTKKKFVKKETGDAKPARSATAAAILGQPVSATRSRNGE